MKKNKNRILAIDYGRKRIGLAITDESGKIPLALNTIETKDSIDKTISFILTAVSNYLFQIKKIIIGNPLLLSGKKGQMALEVENFKENFEKKVDIPIILWDERLSSIQADKILKTQKLKRKKRAKKIDPIAAVIILSSYVESL